MLEDLKSDFKYHPAFTAVILILFIGVWSTLYLKAHIDVDTGWLLQCLDRFMVGGKYGTDFYETNPPLSFLIYLPAYPLYTYAALDPKFSVFIVVSIYVLFSNYILFLLMRAEKYTATDIVVLLSACAMALTWTAGISFGSKDHIITSFLIPLSLYQYRLTFDRKTNRLVSAAAILLGGLAVCLKPHYAIIPAAFFLHRLYTKRSIGACVTSPDFWGMFIIGASYLAFVIIVTPEFFNLLPEIISIYTIERPFPLYYRYYYLLYGAVGFVISFWILKSPAQQVLKNATIGFTVLSFLCLIPYILQDKGFHYQALPILCYGSIVLFIAVYSIAKEIAEKSDYALWSSCVLITLLFFGYTYGYKTFKMTKGQYLALPLVDIIDEKAWNDVYATYDFKNMLTPLPELSNLTNGSRFGQLWPLNGLLEKIKITQDAQERAQIKQQMFHYVDMIAEDMKRYKPSVITIPQFEDPETGEPKKNYYNFLMENENFKENMENYSYDSTVEFDSSLTLMNSERDKIIPHDVFVLKRDNAL